MKSPSSLQFTADDADRILKERSGERKTQGVDRREETPGRWRLKGQQADDAGRIPPVGRNTKPMARMRS
jgi:hypothetical protein